MPKRASPDFALVLMPFDKKNDPVYELGIKSACADAGVACERVDKQVFSGDIVDRIYSQIKQATLIIADVTGKNANVFYEVGYAHALKKNVILLIDDAKDAAFDIEHYPHLTYGGDIITLKKELTRWILKHLGFSSDDRIIYQSKGRLVGHDLKVAAEFIYKKIDGKDVKVSERAQGEVSFTGDVVRIGRTNTAGRYSITLQKAAEKYEKRLRLLLEARVSGGAHTLQFVFKGQNSGLWLCDRRRTISGNKWAKVEEYFSFVPSDDCYFRIDDLNVSTAPSTIEIRNLLLVDESH